MLAFAIALTLPTVSVAQPIVRVRAETRIELQVDRGPTVRITATLRDDRGDPLRDRALNVRIAQADGPGVERASGRTDDRGRVEVDFDIQQTGTYRLEAQYAGDSSYRGVEVAQNVDLGRAHVRLLMTAESGRLDRLDLDRASHEVRVAAESEIGGANLDVRLENEMGQALASGTTGAGGTVQLTIHSADLGVPAAGRIVVRTEGDSLRAPAQTEVLVVRYRPTAVALTVAQRHVEAGRAVLVEGTLSTSQGPLARKAIGIFTGERHLETVLTDAEGRFRDRVVLEQNEGDVPLQARFESDAPWRPEALSEPIVITIEPRGATPAPWLSIPIAVSALLLLGLWWRGRRQAPGQPEQRPSRRPAPPGIQLGAPGSTRQAGHTDVAGVVLDADEANPLGGAQVVLRRGDETLTQASDEDGRFLFDDVPSGRWKLRAQRAGYEAREATVELPHRGQLRGLQIRLRSLRHLVLRRFSPLAEALTPSRRWWAFWTPRELADRARGGERGAVGQVALEVEEIAYAASPPEADRVEEVGRRARRLADAIREDSSAR